MSFTNTYQHIVRYEKSVAVFTTAEVRLITEISEDLASLNLNEQTDHYYKTLQSFLRKTHQIHRLSSITLRYVYKPKSQDKAKFRFFLFYISIK